MSDKKHVNVLPNDPTIIEAGIPGYDADLWFGLSEPAKLPAERLNRIHRDIVTALGSSEVRECFATLVADGIESNPAAFTASLKAENAKCQKVVKASGAKID